MANYLATGNKKVWCQCCNCYYQIPFQTTITKCPTCKKYNIFTFSGVVKDKHDNYIY